MLCKSNYFLVTIQIFLQKNEKKIHFARFSGGKGGIWESVLKVRFSGDGPVMVMFGSSLFVKKHCNLAKGWQGCSFLEIYHVKHSHRIVGSILIL